jgi:hypothetical protein
MMDDPIKIMLNTGAAPPKEKEKLRNPPIFFVT